MKAAIEKYLVGLSVLAGAAAQPIAANAMGTMAQFRDVDSGWSTSTIFIECATYLNAFDSVTGIDNVHASCYWDVGGDSPSVTRPRAGTVDTLVVNSANSPDEVSNDNNYIMSSVHKAGLQTGGWSKIAYDSDACNPIPWYGCEWGSC